MPSTHSGFKNFSDIIKSVASFGNYPLHLKQKTRVEVNRLEIRLI